ncbi:MAG: lipoyl domain-containing protein [Leptospira sp.]|nr:lipoyl domain-containing protein [Leptospira sp.]
MKKNKEEFDLKTPDLGDSESIELVKWYVKEGADIDEGQEILELVTDKAAFPVESPFKGRLQKILKPEGSKVITGEILGVMEI